MEVAKKQRPIRHSVGQRLQEQRSSVLSSSAFRILRFCLFLTRGLARAFCATAASPHISVVSTFSAENRRECNVQLSGREGILTLKLSKLGAHLKGMADLY